MADSAAASIFGGWVTVSKLGLQVWDLGFGVTGPTTARTAAWWVYELYHHDESERELP